MPTQAQQQVLAAGAELSVALDAVRGLEGDEAGAVLAAARPALQAAVRSLLCAVGPTERCGPRVAAPLRRPHADAAAAAVDLVAGYVAYLLGDLEEAVERIRAAVTWPESPPEWDFLHAQVRSGSVYLATLNPSSSEPAHLRSGG
jgi:hypothetical protein